jgi:hypothetical protein
MKAVKKAFDWLRLKRSLPSNLHKKWAGLTTEQTQADIEHGLATSQTDLAQWWRRATKAQTPKKGN